MSGNLRSSGSSAGSSRLKSGGDRGSSKRRRSRRRPTKGPSSQVFGASLCVGAIILALVGVISIGPGAAALKARLGLELAQVEPDADQQLAEYQQLMLAIYPRRGQLHMRPVWAQLTLNIANMASDVRPLSAAAAPIAAISRLKTAPGDGNAWLTVALANLEAWREVYALRVKSSLPLETKEGLADGSVSPVADPAALESGAVVYTAQEQDLLSKSFEAFRRSFSRGQYDLRLAIPRLQYCVNVVNNMPDDIYSICELQADILSELAPEEMARYIKVLQESTAQT